MEKVIEGIVSSLVTKFIFNSCIKKEDLDESNIISLLESSIIEFGRDAILHLIDLSGGNHEVLNGIDIAESILKSIKDGINSKLQVSK